MGCLRTRSLWEGGELELDVLNVPSWPLLPSPIVPVSGVTSRARTPEGQVRGEAIHVLCTGTATKSKKYPYLCTPRHGGICGQVCAWPPLRSTAGYPERVWPGLAVST